MYTSVPPRPGDVPDPGAGWGLRRTVRSAFPESAQLNSNAEHTRRLGVYVADLLRPYGLDLEPGGIERGGQSYGEMAEALIASAVPPGEEVDLLVLAYGIPDITPGRATATYLSEVCPGNPLAFAISDQGAAAAFTGLRLIRDYAATGGLRRALLVVVEQSELPYDTAALTTAALAPASPSAIPAAHSGVALLFGELSDAAVHSGLPDTADPAADLAVDVAVDLAGLSDRAARLGAVSVHPESSIPGLAGELAALCAESAGASGTTKTTGTTAILGADLAARVSELAGVDQVQGVPAGRPYTGVWWELAGALSEADAPGRRLVLADYDSALHYLCFAAIDVDGAVDVDSTAVATSGSSTASLPSGRR
jgi:hypothetical protein